VLKNKFIKTFLLILIASFFFTSSVYAKMRVMSEDDLTLVDAKNGLTVALNANIYLQAASIGLYTTTAQTSGIVLPNLVIDGTVDTTTDNYTNPFAVNINSTIELDIGTLSGKTWLNISGLNIYNAMGLTSKGIYIEDGANDRILGDLYIRGIFMGRTLTNGTTGYSPPGNTQTFTMGSLPSITVSPHATQGLDLYVSLNAYINTLEYRFRPADSTNEFKISGIYACASFTGNPQTPSTWVGSGNLRLGNFAYNQSYGTYDKGSITTTLYAAADVGTLSGKTYLNLNLPMTGSIRVNDFRMDSTGSFGPIAVDGMTMRTVNVRLYNL
jgi:hypothetical protein